MTENEAKVIRFMRNVKDDTIIIESDIIGDRSNLDYFFDIIHQEKNAYVGIIKESISELDKYRTIGTVEECRGQGKGRGRRNHIFSLTVMGKQS